MKEDVFFEGHLSDSYQNLHIGSLIKEIVEEKQIPSKQLSDAINRYEKNADKIYKLEDMDVEDVVRISYSLEYPILDNISKKYMSHLPVVRNKPAQEQLAITFYIKTRRYDLHEITGTCDFLKNIHVGKFIKEVAERNGWNEQNVADRLGRAQNTISNLYTRKSMQVKEIIRISNVFQHNLISDLYLSRMMILHPFKMFDQCTISVIDGHFCFERTDANKTFSIIFRPREDNKFSNS